MKIKFASLVILSFNRRKMMERSLNSLFANTTFPYELIVVDDGSHDDDTVDYLMRLYRLGKISTLILNGGKNMGVGVGINRGFDIAHGDIVLKLDADLEYAPGWLEKTVKIMETFPEIGVMGLFKYFHEPVDHRKMFIRREERDGVAVEVHQDFVGSAMVITKELYNKKGKFGEFSAAFAEDTIWKMARKSEGYWLALPEEDLVYNFGFGRITSILVNNDGTVRDIAQEPLIFNK